MTEEKDRRPVILVFGLDEQRRTRAGAFAAEHQAEAIKRAEGVKFVHKPVSATPDLLKMAAGVPFGDLSKPATAFVPIVVRTLYDRLLAASGVTGSGFGGASTGKDRPTMTPERRPSSWNDIDVGHTVLVPEDEAGEGWFEATVVSKAGPDLFLLKYRDFPDFVTVECARQELALLPPKN